MRFLKRMFNPPYPQDARKEVDRLINELLSIGEKEDFLSETPGGRYNRRCRHIRTREIGKRLDELGGYELMAFAYDRVQKKLGRNLSDHLDFAWFEVGHWTNLSE